MISAETWCDFKGRNWPVIRSGRRLKFKYPAHAALRSHVFYRDMFRCQVCSAVAINVPPDYDGRDALSTNTFTGSGYPDVLVLDHILTLRAGGRSLIENLRALCETCNRKKIPRDIADARRFKAVAP